MSGGQTAPRTVLITGAAGFIGTAVCARLHALGYRVVGYDDLSRGRREHLPHGMELVVGDIRDAARVRDVVEEVRPAVLIHLAAMHFIPDCVARPEATLDVNVEGTRRVLDACRGSSVRSVLFASTGAVYAPSDAPCLEDGTPLGPLEVYGTSKVEGEALSRTFQAETGIATTILRLFNAIGRHETNPHVVPHIFESLQRSDVVELGNTDPKRDYIDTRDIADAMVAVIEPADGLRVFNVGSGRAYSVDELVDRLRRLLGRPIVVSQDPSRMRRSERMLLAADISRIRAATGWAPRLSLDDTLRDLIDAYGLAGRRPPRDG